jgi:hypothetical protein
VTNRKVRRTEARQVKIHRDDEKHTERKEEAHRKVRRNLKEMTSIPQEMRRNPLGDEEKHKQMHIWTICLIEGELGPYLRGC